MNVLKRNHWSEHVVVLVSIPSIALPGFRMIRKAARDMFNEQTLINNIKSVSARHRRDDSFTYIHTLHSNAGRSKSGEKELCPTYFVLTIPHDRIHTSFAALILMILFGHIYSTFEM